jgi:hypothetical protein
MGRRAVCRGSGGCNGSDYFDTMKTPLSSLLLAALATSAIAHDLRGPYIARPRGFLPQTPEPEPDPREGERHAKANRLKREAKAAAREAANRRAAEMNPAWSDRVAVPVTGGLGL